MSYIKIINSYQELKMICIYLEYNLYTLKLLRMHTLKTRRVTLNLNNRKNQLKLKCTSHEKKHNCSLFRYKI